MRYVIQFCLILLITFIGELLNALIPLPIPAGIYGMALMFAGLCLKIIPLDAVADTADFLIAVMPVMFIPACVGLMDSWGALKPMLIPAAIAIVGVTVIVMGVAGTSAQGMIRAGKRRERR